MRYPEDNARETLERETEKVDEQDLDMVVGNWQRIEHKIRHSRRLSGYAGRAVTAYELLRDYIRGDYREIPWGSIASLTAALLYVLNPMDVVPDFIPLFGFIDDASVLALCLKLIGRDLEKYQQSRRQDQPEP